MYTELLQKQAGIGCDLKTEKLIHSLAAQVFRLKELTEHLFDTSSIQTGQLQLHTHSVIIDELVSEIVQANTSLAAHHVINFKGRSLKKVSIDITRISQVLNNLMTNAVKYSPHAKEIVVHIMDDTDRVIVSVQDFGSGIPNEKQKQIFNRFYRTMEGKDVAAGLGLGLYISYNIMKAHGGDMWVKSEVGKGSTFFISLPIKR